MVQGRGVDAPLNDTGRNQAQKVYQSLKSISFDAVFTSELQRAQQTVAPFIADGITHFTDEGFDEISWGNQEGVQADPAALNLYAETVKGWREGKLELNVGGGESPIEVMERQKKAMNNLINCKGEIILLCMHGRAMRILLCWLLNYPLNYMDGFPHENCAYYKLIYRDRDYFIDGFNIQDHLT